LTASERGNKGLKSLDWYLGIPVVCALGLLRRKRPPVIDFSTLGLLETAAIGDTVLLAGVIADLRRAFPDKKIILFTGGSNYEVASLLRGPDEVVKLPLADPLEAIRIMRARHLEILCDFGPWPRINAVLTLFSGARFTLGFRTPGQYRHYAYDRAVDHSAAVHELENQRNLVSPLGVDPTSMPFIAADEPLALGLPPKSYVVFHAWSGGYKGYIKEWPAAYWVDLGERMVRLGPSIVLTGGPYDRVRTANLRASFAPRWQEKVITLAGSISLSQTCKVLQDAAAVVSVNTGIMHLAAAVGAAVLALNGPVPARRWGPVGEWAVSVDSEAEGCGYLNLGFEYENQREDCMALIRPERVFLLLKELLERTAAAQPVRGTTSRRGDGFAWVAG
jgi:ADP-heptose:LPS heptosyltransferase